MLKKKKHVVKSNLYLSRSLFGQPKLVADSLWFVLLAFARLETVFPRGSLAFVLVLFWFLLRFYPFF